MQLSELLYQRVKELGERGQLALKPGYAVVVGKSRSLGRVLLGALFLNPDDQRNLVQAPGPTRVGVGLVGNDGASYRLLRELSAGRQLQRLDPTLEKYVQLSSDDLEIDTFLRLQCGLPSADVFTGFFVFQPDELPSQRGRPAGLAEVDQVKVAALQDELQQTRRFEGLQDRLFKTQQRLHALNTLAARLAAAEGALAALDAELARSLFAPAQMQDLAAKAAAAPRAQKDRDEVISEIVAQRQRLARSVPPPPGPLLRDPLFGGGIAGGVLLDGVAFALTRPSIALLGLVPFAVALIAFLRWVAADEADAEAATEVKRLKDREESVRRAFAEDQAALKAAMKIAAVEAPAELLEVFKAREAVAAQREQARLLVEKVRDEPDLPRIPIETPLLEAERRGLEAEVLRQGFARPLGEIEIDLRHALGLAGEKASAPKLADAEVPAGLVERGADLMQLAPDELWAQLSARLPAYLAALTDRRIVDGKVHASGQLLLLAADGRGGPYQSLPQPLRDLAYAALRLALFEKVAAYKKLPIFIDDAFGGFEPGKRVLAHKMLKAISALTQVVHRTAEAPPHGLADHLAQAP